MDGQSRRRVGGSEPSAPHSPLGCACSQELCLLETLSGLGTQLPAVEGPPSPSSVRIKD